VVWPEPSGIDEQDERTGLHWKTRALVGWAAGRPFAWIDDEITEADQVRVSTHRVDPRHGLTDADYGTLTEWLLRIHETPPDAD
jgi:hypothetical protein